MIKRPLIRAVTVAGLSASMLVSTAANAAFTEPGVPAIVSRFPADMASWLATPNDFSWNPINARLGRHPDRPDGVVYIFPDEATANAWWDGVTGSPPEGIPDSAVAYVHWKLDNNSGEFPGIMAISDDKTFKTNNCIMAAGTTIPEGGGVAKTCGNPQGSSKRFKLVILKADADIDITFNTTTKDLEYANYDRVDVETDIFRNYRYIMKVGNGTATDTVKLDGTPVINDGTRLAGVKVELGFTDLNTGVFTATTPDESDGLAYELRLCIPDAFFDEKSGQTTPGTSDCPAGETEVWLENEFATFSPSMYSKVGDKRRPEGGYWDKNPAGIYAPQIQKANMIDSGQDPYEANLTSPPESALYDPFPANGQIGQITTNYFDVGAAQAAGAAVPIPDNMFGYMMYYGVFADGDAGIIPMGIYEDDDGDPTTEGGIYAWWDGSSPTCCYRWGIDRDHDGVVGPDAWGILSDADLAEVAARPLDENEILDPPRYEIAYMDDLGGLNMDTFIKFTPAYDEITNPTFTIRFRGDSIATAGVATGSPGTADGPWVATPAPEPEVPVTTEVPVASDDDNGLFGLGFSWVTGGLLVLGLILRRRRF